MNEAYICEQITKKYFIYIGLVSFEGIINGASLTDSVMFLIGDLDDYAFNWYKGK